MTRDKWAKLSAKQKEVAVANWVGDNGWTWEDCGCGIECHPPCPGQYHVPLPYLNDLNAMQNAVRLLTNEQYWDFEIILSDIVGVISNTSRTESRKLVQASAEQLAEAFALTMEPENEQKEMG